MLVFKIAQVSYNKVVRFRLFLAASRLTVISQTVEYSLRATVALAHRGDEPCTVQQLAAITEVPAAYLAKLMQRLVRCKLVVSKRGLHGGFLLAKDPNNLTIWDIVDAVEPLQRIRECPLKIGSHGDALCPLHRRLDQAMVMVEKSLRETTLAELLSASNGKPPLCTREKTAIVSISLPVKKPKRAKR